MQRETKIPALNKQWEDGVPIGLTWFSLAPEYAKNMYRNASDHGRDAQRMLMEADILSYIASGQLKCIGIRTDRKAELERGPQLVPSFLFSNRHAVDWSKQTLTAHRVRYEQLRISEFGLDEFLIKIDGTPRPSTSNETQHNPSKPILSPIEQSERNRGGRPSFKRGMDEAFAEMNRLGQIDISTASHKHIYNFVDDYFKRHSDRFTHAPKDRTISSYISKFRRYKILK